MVCPYCNNHRDPGNFYGLGRGKPIEDYIVGLLKSTSSSNTTAGVAVGILSSVEVEGKAVLYSRADLYNRTRQMAFYRPDYNRERITTTYNPWDTKKPNETNFTKEILAFMYYNQPKQ